MESLNVDQVKSTAENAKAALTNSATELAEKGMQMMHAQADDFAKTAANIKCAAEKQIKAHPLASVAIAAGFGVLCAGLASSALRTTKH